MFEKIEFSKKRLLLKDVQYLNNTIVGGKSSFIDLKFFTLLEFFTSFQAKMENNEIISFGSMSKFTMISISFTQLFCF